MNQWTKLSMEYAYSEGYFDKLQEIYPIYTNPIRKMPLSLVKKIKQAYNNGESQKLIILLNEGVKKYELKFPIDNSYTSILRIEDEWIKKNPKTVNAVGEILMSYDLDVLLDRCITPKKVSRQMGPLFTKWFNKTFNKDREIGILGKTDTERKGLAEILTKYDDKKGIDLMVLINNIHIFGEAKFISAKGGSQGNQFNSALNIFKNYKKGKNRLPIAILDGICWKECKDKYYKRLINSKDNEIIISALLLEDLFHKIKEIEVPEQKLTTNEIIEFL